MRHPATPLIALVPSGWEECSPRARRLLARAARTRPVVAVEAARDGAYVALARSRTGDGVALVRPRVPSYLAPLEAETIISELLAELPEFACRAAVDLWVAAPMLVPYADELPVRLTAFDHAGDLAERDDPPEGLPLRLRDLLGVADVVFAGDEARLAVALADNPSSHLVPSPREDSAEEWDHTWARMDRLMAEALEGRAPTVPTGAPMWRRASEV